MDTPVGKVTMLNRQQIQSIVKMQGLNANFRENVDKRGNGTSRVYVRAFKYVSQAKGNIFIDLGRIEQVAAMSQDELVKTIQQKFAEKLRLKLQVANNS